MSRMLEKSGGKKIGEKLLVGGAAFMVAVGGAACGNDANATPVEQEDTSAGSGPVEEGIVPNVDDYLPEDVTIDGDEPEEYLDEESGAPEFGGVAENPNLNGHTQEAYDAAKNVAEKDAKNMQKYGGYTVTKIEIFPPDHPDRVYMIHYTKEDGSRSVSVLYWDEWSWARDNNYDYNNR